VADIVLTTPQIVSLITPGLRKAIFSTVDTFPKQYRSVFNMVPQKPGSGTGKAFFDDTLVRSVGRLAPKAEYAPIDFDNIAVVGTVRYTPYTFALGARISEESIEDELYGIVSKIGAELGAAAQYEIELQAFKIINLGFGVTGGGTGFNPTGPTNEPLFGTAHVISRGGTFPNTPVVNLDLSQAALEEAMTNFRRIPNESGLPQPKMPKKLLIPPELEWVAKKILMSEYEPDTANNAVNPTYKAVSYEIVHYITNPAMWVLLSTDHDLNVWIRRGIRTQTEADFNHGGVKTKVSFRIGTGHSGWRGTYGSPGS
jgi:phage major head subunit gpT-like protein